LKNKKIKKAIIKSNIVNEPIKIAITGSYWKSSVKELLSSILEQDWKLLKTPKNINTELWVTSIVLDKLKNKYKYFVAEIWAYRIWEISILWKIVNHKYWFLTAIWNQHIWLFANQENIVKSKSEIVESILKNDWILYLNIDNKENAKANFPKKLNIVKYWKSKKADAKYKIIEETKSKFEFEFTYKKINTQFKLDIVWEHNIINLTWIIACCYDLGLKTNEIKKYLKNIKLPEANKSISELDYNLPSEDGKSIKLILIDDTYNLSEAWLNSWIRLFKSYKGYNRILVLDDILELWKDAEKIHFELAEKIAEKKQIDFVLYCWVNYKKSFIDWLIKWWFDKRNILMKLDSISKKSVILFEWKRAKNYKIF
jgi:UDP-N-acetylmuramoyl-tripeptide--D-alanyl-D-alanine ligase